MIITCPKCNKEIVESDIEMNKSYCRSCMEWFVLKDDVIKENSPKKNSFHLNNDISTLRKKESYIVYFCLVLLLCFSAFMESYLSILEIMHFFRQSAFANLLGKPWITDFKFGLSNALYRLIAYGGMGLLGVFLASKAGFKNILNDEIKKRRNILIIISAGIAMGLYFIGYRKLLYKIFQEPLLYYGDFPASIFVSFADGIGDQILNMLRISFFVWIFSKVIKSKKGRLILFWTGAVLFAVLFVVEHIATTPLYNWGGYRNIFRISSLQFRLIFGLYAPLSLVCTWFFKKFGLLSAITVHVIANLMWYVLLTSIMDYLYEYY